MMVKFVIEFAVGALFTYKMVYKTNPRLIIHLSLSGFCWQTKGLAGNSKPLYKVCDSKKEKFTP